MPTSFENKSNALPDDVAGMAEMITLLEAEKQKILNSIAMQYRKMGDRELRKSQQEAEATLDFQLLYY